MFLLDTKGFGLGISLATKLGKQATSSEYITNLWLRLPGHVPANLEVYISPK